MVRPIWVSLIIAAILMVGGLLLLGIPGAIIGALADPIVQLVRGLPGPLMDGDRAWPLAILLTLAVPPAIPVTVLAQRIWRPAMPFWQLTLLALAVLYIWTVVLMFILSF